MECQPTGCHPGDMLTNLPRSFTLPYSLLSQQVLVLHITMNTAIFQNCFSFLRLSVVLPVSCHVEQQVEHCTAHSERTSNSSAIESVCQVFFKSFVLGLEYLKIYFSVAKSWRWQRVGIARLENFVGLINLN